MLIPDSRHDRNPLGPWSETLLKRLDRIDFNLRGNWILEYELLTDLFNEVALIQAYLGRTDRAAEVCTTSIKLTAALMDATRCSCVARFLFQPFINCGRLDRRSGQWDQALGKFEKIHSFLSGNDITIHAVHLTAKHCEEIRRTAPAFLSRIEANYVIESLSTLLQAERFGTVLSFKASIISRGQWFSDFAPEAELIALSYSGAADTALASAQAYVRQAQPQHVEVFAYREAELLMLQGNARRAVKRCRSLALDQLGRQSGAGDINLKLTLFITRLLAACRDRLAKDLIRYGLRLSKSRHDVLFESEFLSVLIVFDGDRTERAFAEAQLKAIPRRAWYGAAKSGMSSDWFEGNIGITDTLFDKALSKSREFQRRYL